jgi:hypothetical protein
MPQPSGSEARETRLLLSLRTARGIQIRWMLQSLLQCVMVQTTIFDCLRLPAKTRDPTEEAYEE